ncbi:MAG: ExbD/TolR family protein [Gemmataceae bacterium]
MWSIRFEGTSNLRSVDTAHAVLEGIRDGLWEPSDEVRGPGDTGYRLIEEHPLFADVIAEMGPPEKREPEDNHLDMNPLIDVCLVLLIFFILTTTYESLRRTLDVPAEPEDKAAAQKKLQEDLKDKAFTVTAWMDVGKPKVKIEDDLVDLKELDSKMKQIVKSTGRSEMMLEVEGKVPWGVEAAIHDAARGASVYQIYRKKKKD